MRTPSLGAKVGNKNIVLDEPRLHLTSFKKVRIREIKSGKSSM